MPGGYHAASGGGNVAGMPAFAPANSLANEGDLVGKIIKEGKIDPEALAISRPKAMPSLARLRTS